MAFAIRIDQKSGMLPPAAISATPIAPKANAAAHSARARISRLWSQDTSNRHAPTANADTEMIKSVGRSNITIVVRRRSPADQDFRQVQMVFTSDFVSTTFQNLL